MKRDLYSVDWKRLPVNLGFPNRSAAVSEPDNFKEMVRISEELSRDLDHVRVDLYSNGEKIKFGELTNYNSGGFQPFFPSSADFWFGAEWHPDSLY